MDKRSVCRVPGSYRDQPLGRFKSLQFNKDTGCKRPVHTTWGKTLAEFPWVDLELRASLPVSRHLLL